MNRKMTTLMVAMAVMLPAAAVAEMKRTDSTDTVALASVEMNVEINATDGDAGLQPSFDGEPWRRAKIWWPDGRKLLDLKTKWELRGYGLTEFFSESNEPPFDEFPIEEFKALFPEGDYSFLAVAIDGTRQRGTATLTHDFPKGPKMVTPIDDGVVPPGDLVIKWKPVTKPAGIEVVAYTVVLSNEDTGLSLEAELGAEATSYTVPQGWLTSGEYKVEVAAVEVSGNATFTETVFSIS